MKHIALLATFLFLCSCSSTGGSGFFDNSSHQAGADAANAANAAANHNMHHSPPPASF